MPRGRGAKARENRRELALRERLVGAKSPMEEAMRPASTMVAICGAAQLWVACGRASAAPAPSESAAAATRVVTSRRTTTHIGGGGRSRKSFGGLKPPGASRGRGYSGSVRRFAALLPLALAALLLAVGCGGSSGEEDAAPPEPLPTQPSATTSSPSTPDRPPAPPIDGLTVDGERISLSDFRGRPVLVNVWSSW